VPAGLNRDWKTDQEHEVEPDCLDDQFLIEQQKWRQNKAEESNGLSSFFSPLNQERQEDRSMVVNGGYTENPSLVFIKRL
jgi:hypothetical protein